MAASRCECTRALDHASPSQRMARSAGGEQQAGSGHLDVERSFVSRPRIHVRAVDTSVDGPVDRGPIGWAILPLEIAQSVSFLLSEWSSAITGTPFIVERSHGCSRRSSC